MQSAKSKAEQKFSKLNKRSEKAPQEWERAQQERADKTARLRALRLAKEAAEREAAGTAPAEDEAPPS